MKVPLPCEIEIGEYQIAMAIANQLVSQWGSPDIFISHAAYGIRIDFGTDFERDHPDEAIMARAVNVLMERAATKAIQ